MKKRRCFGKRNNAMDAKNKRLESCGSFFFSLCFRHNLFRRSVILFLFFIVSLFSYEKDIVVIDIQGYEPLFSYCSYHGTERESGMKVFYTSLGDCENGKVGYCYGWESFDAKANRWNGEGTCKIRNE